MDNIFSDEHWHVMCSAGMSYPVPLHEADLTRSCVYSRAFGVFYVDFGHHQLVMSTLLAWQHGILHALDIAEKLKLHPYDGTADYWLKTTAGTAFKSSLGGHIFVGKPEHLNAYERRWIKNITYLFEDKDS